MKQFNTIFFRHSKIKSVNWEFSDDSIINQNILIFATLSVQRYRLIKLPVDIIFVTEINYLAISNRQTRRIQLLMNKDTFDAFQSHIKNA